MPTTSNFGWTTPADTDLVKDGAAAIRTLGNGIDTSFLDLKGGTTDQVLAKNSNTDLDFKWVAQDDSNAIQNAIVDAKGDLISATAADTPARLAVGANGTVLTADSAEATGLKWATPAGGFGTPISYTPTFSNLTLGNGTVSAQYAVSGDIVYYQGILTLGSTSSVSGGFSISTPFNTVSTFDYAYYMYLGQAVARDVSAGTYFQSNTLGGTNLDNLNFNAYVGSNWNATTPFTWANTDKLAWFIFYRKAT